MNKNFIVTVALTLSSLLTSSALATPVQPDAGQAIQSLDQDALERPKKSPDFNFGIPQSKQKVTDKGPKVLIKHIKISGNKSFSDKQLRDVIGKVKNKKMTMSEIKNLASKITDFYHKNDHPFAKAFIPSQSSNSGKVIIKVVEGNYGKVTVSGDKKYSATAKKFLSSLKRGNPITGKHLERVSLILDDQPGLTFTPAIKPGKKVGEGDLTYYMKKTQKHHASLTTDNAGNRYTGRGRAIASYSVDSPFLFGDQINVNAIYTEENLWYGSASYNLPLGYTGFRGNVSYAHTYYDLGKEFSSLKATGTADIASAGLSYPVIRSQKSNLSVAVNYMKKWLNDKVKTANTDNKKNSNSFPLAMNFDHRDSILGGGITFGTVSWTHGILSLDSTLKAADISTAKSDGNYDKINIDVARLQRTPIDNFTVYARFSGQKAFDNLDSSEDYGVGGPNGVRAYPTGEAFGDEGYVGQLEIRYQIEKFTPYAFYDYGYSKRNYRNWTTSNNKRNLGGPGIGVRANHKGWNANLSAAWRTVGGDPRSTTKKNRPTVWASLGYKY